MNECNHSSSAPAWLDSILEAALQALTIYRGRVRGKISLALVVGGVAVIGQGWLEVLASAAWEIAVGKPLSFPDISPLYGVVLVLLGLVFFAWTAIDERRAAAATRHTLAAIRHESMEGVTHPLQESALPPSLAGADIHVFKIDQSPFYAAGILTAPAAAVRVQIDLIHRVRALLAAKPDAEVIYYGKAHIPLVFLAGHSLSTGLPTRFYELDRQSGGWWAIDDNAEGDDLGLNVERAAEHSDAPDTVIRISISYAVKTAEVAEALRPPYRDVHLSIAKPRLDAVRTRRQINAIAGAFRRLLDELKSEQPGPSRIHVFYCGPMSLGFCLGRQISPTIHPPVFVYNFTAKTTPRYAWALHVNGNGLPESLIVPTLAAAA